MKPQISAGGDVEDLTVEALPPLEMSASSLVSSTFLSTCSLYHPSRLWRLLSVIHTVVGSEVSEHHVVLTHILCGNSTASLFSVFHSLSDISLSFAEFPAPCWAPCCDPLLNILYHLNLPAVIPQTAEVLPHESTETSGYTSVLYLICMCLTLKCLLFLFVIPQRTICWLLECASRLCF